MLPNAHDYEGQHVTGSVFYEGPSRIDRRPIVAIATYGTHNLKTGPVIQTWVLRADINPIVASQTGGDFSVCGDCVHRGVANGEVAVGRSCYVTLLQAPLQVFTSYKKGNYPAFDDEVGYEHHLGTPLRLGSYGDPAAVPEYAWGGLLRYAARWTGYTHAWRQKKFAWLRPYVMASCDSEADKAEAKKKGWRTFRVRLAEDPLLGDEIACPASEEAGYRRSCASCLACDGADRPGKRSVTILGHGNRPIHSNLARNLTALKA